jgi:DNA repair exonuclease SbcCD nuclease subunit
MRFVHTSDWQIGKTSGLGTRPVRDERVDIVSRVGHLARQGWW